MKSTTLFLLGVALSLMSVGTVKADPQVRYIIVNDHYNSGQQSHWRGKRLDSERYRAFGRDYREPVLYGSRHAKRHADYYHDRQRNHHNDRYRSHHEPRNPYQRSGREHWRNPYDRGRTVIVIPTHEQRGYRSSNDRHHQSRYSNSGSRLIINFD